MMQCTETQKKIFEHQWFKLQASFFFRFALRWSSSTSYCPCCHFTKMSRVFSLVGDSNIKRHMNPTNCRDPVMSGCQVLHCGCLAALAESLKSIRAESNVLILACISNFVTRSEESGSIANCVEPIFRKFASVISAEASKYAGRYYLVSPPMYRKTPLWYRDGLSEVMARFPVSFKELPRNVLLMSSFNNPVLDPDGVHLSAYSGLEYVQHLLH